MKYRLTYKDKHTDIRLTEWTEEFPDASDVGQIIGYLVKAIGYSNGIPLAMAIVDMAPEDDDPMARNFYDAASAWVEDSGRRMARAISGAEPTEEDL